MQTYHQCEAHLDAHAEPAWEVALLFPSQGAAPGAWSEQEYLDLDTNRLVEFSHGSIEVLPTPSDRHQSIVAFLYGIFVGLANRLGGKVLFSPLRLQLWSGKFREPDLVFLADARDPRRQEEYWTGADLVVEVVSPDDPRRDWVTKRFEYAQAGIAEYWIVDPRDETITVLRLEGSSYAEHGRFGRGAVATSARFAELTAPVAAVFDAD